MTKVLTIDDLDEVTFSIIKSLEQFDYEVEKANTGKQGIELAQSFKPDVILLDLMMPDMSGWQCLKILKSNVNTKDIPVIILSAKDDEMSKQMGEQSAEDFIVKPFEAEDLNNKIKAVLS